MCLEAVGHLAHDVVVVLVRARRRVEAGADCVTVVLVSTLPSAVPAIESGMPIRNVPCCQLSNT